LWSSAKALVQNTSDIALAATVILSFILESSALIYWNGFEFCAYCKRGDYRKVI
jgi:hypothetical protein